MPELPLVSLSVPIFLTVVEKPAPTTVNIPILMTVTPPVPDFVSGSVEYDTMVKAEGIPVPLEAVMTALMSEITSNKIASFWDPSRQLKTLMNLGDDRQLLLTNWVRDVENIENGQFLLKLYEPLPFNIEEKDLFWISRIISPTLLDRVSVIVTPEQGVVFFLRPPFLGVEGEPLFGISVDGVSLGQLLPSGSAEISGSELVLNDPLLNQWYTTNIQGIELNTDYTDYNNFVHFSSAEGRLESFREKLIQIEQINESLGFQTLAASMSLVSSSITNISGTAQYNSIEDLTAQKSDLIRGLDGYERFLYYDSGTFSGSISGLEEDPVIQIADVAWPKDGSGNVLSVTASSAITWYDSQIEVAQEYDLGNQEYLVNNLPEYLRDDTDSADYQQFLKLIGHHFDLVKLYIDDMVELYDRDVSPDRGMSKELIWHVARSLGIALPNQYAIKQLVDYAVTGSTATQDTYAEATAETWKRFLHNQIYISKAKGTRTGLEGLLNAYGIDNSIIRIRESSTPSSVADSGSFETFQEPTNVVTLTSHIQVPFSSSGYDPDVIEVRFATTNFVSGTILEGDGGEWKVQVRPTGSAAGKRGTIVLISGSTDLLETDPAIFFDNDFYTLMLRRNSATSFDMTVKRFELDVWQYQYGPEPITDGGFTGSWADVENVNVGSSAADGLKGSIDEIRVWKEITTDATFDNHVKFPGLYAGNVSSSALDHLLVRHSFGKPQDLVANVNIPNESPFITSGSTAPANVLTASVAVGFATSSGYPYNMAAIIRETQRFVPNAGGTQYTSDKVKILPEATFAPEYTIVSGTSEIPVLSRFRSVRSPDRQNVAKSDNRIGVYFTLSETINDSILRSVGQIDLSQLIGDPANIYSDEYPELKKLNEFYIQNYAPSASYNTFIEYTEDLLEAFFDQTETLVPVGSSLLTGIVVEPTILERTKIAMVAPPSTDGQNTRIESMSLQILAESGSLPGTRNADAPISQSMLPNPGSDMNLLEGLVPDIIEQDPTATVQRLEVELTDTQQEPYAFLNLLEEVIDTDEVITPISALTLLEPIIDTYESESIAAFINQLEATIDEETVAVTRTDVQTEQGFVLPFAEPQPIHDPAGSVYFTHPTGSYGIIGWDRIRVRENILNDRGTWVEGETYATNDMVIQLSQSGSASVGNNVEFRCLTTNVVAPNGSIVNFVSTIPPYLDTANWVAVNYIRREKYILKKAIVDPSGSANHGLGRVAIVEPDTTEAPFTGYDERHYKYYRPNGTAWKCVRYDGCKQSGDTTIDGQPAVEILPSSEAQLFVRDGTPVITTTDEGGPPLEVR